MRTIPRVLAAGVPNELAVAGRYFRLMATTGPVDVDLMKGGRVVEEATGVEAGYWAIPDGGYDGVLITSATPQTIQIAVTQGSGGYDRSAGSVQITGGIVGIDPAGNVVKIQDSAGLSLYAVGPGTAITSAYRSLLTQDSGYSYGAAFQSTTSNAANTPQNIIAAGSNLNGYVLLGAGFMSNAATQQIASYLAKATAPTLVTDGDVLQQSGFVTGSVVNSLPMGQAIRVASGLRLDYIAGVLETTACFRHARYRMF